MASNLRRKARAEPPRVWTKFAEPAKEALELMSFSKPLPMAEAEAVLSGLERQRGA